MSMDDARLIAENAAHSGTGGVSRGNRDLGFRPAFLDCATMRIYPSCFADARPAPIHVLYGLPEEVRGRSTIISGFERAGFFYTRTAAARACEQWVREP